jgi:hypothetical protein
MKETYFCTKTKKIQKKSQKSSENRGNEKSKCDRYGLRYTCAGGGFFCSGYRSLIGKVLRFFSLKFRSLGGFWAESILGGWAMHGRASPSKGEDGAARLILRAAMLIE